MKEMNHKKVSLYFYSQEEGKKVLKNKWGIESGKKYIIGRSNKKSDIILDDISISRVQAEILFYNPEKIMIKDLDSSNGTFINKDKIQPYREYYFTVRDCLYVGNEQNEFIFEIPE